MPIKWTHSKKVIITYFVRCKIESVYANKVVSFKEGNYYSFMDNICVRFYF